MKLTIIWNNWKSSFNVAVLIMPIRLESTRINTSGSLSMLCKMWWFSGKKPFCRVALKSILVVCCVTICIFYAHMSVFFNCIHYRYGVLIKSVVRKNNVRFLGSLIRKGRLHAYKRRLFLYLWICILEKSVKEQSGRILNRCVSLRFLSNDLLLKTYPGESIPNNFPN